MAQVQAEHANARSSAEYAADTGLSLVQALGTDIVLESKPFMALLGLGSQVDALLAFSRAQEREGDMLGLQHRARAGFDPEAAVHLWRNMAEVSGKGGPAFLSTPPSEVQRISGLQAAAMPRAQAVYHTAVSEGRPPAAELQVKLTSHGAPVF